MAGEREKGILDKNKELARRSLEELWSKGDMTVVDQIYSDKYILHFPIGPAYKGRKGVKDQVREFRSSFPDWTERAVDMIAEGDKVMVRFISTGTHRGEFNGIPPTGRRIAIQEVAILRIKDGRIVEEWGFPDLFGLHQQLT